MDNFNTPSSVFSAKKNNDEVPELTMSTVFTGNKDNKNAQEKKRTVENAKPKEVKPLLSTVQPPEPFLPPLKPLTLNKPTAQSSTPPPQPKVDKAQPQKSTIKEQHKPQIPPITTNPSVKVPKATTKGHPNNNNDLNVDGIIFRGIAVLSFIIVLIISMTRLLGCS